MKNENIQNILVAGAGTMGHGIAQFFAQNGYNVNLYSRTSQTLDRARSLIHSSLNTCAQAGMIKVEQIPEIIKRIKMTQSLEDGCLDADIAFETVTENKELKTEIFKKLDRFCPPKTILASNTTALNIFDFVRTSRPERVLVVHWYTPPQLIPLVDVVKGKVTSEKVIQTIMDLLKKTGKYPLLLRKFISGYIVSRIQIAMMREILYLLDTDIVTPEQLDSAAKAGLALRMMVLGLVQRIDFGGLDLSVRNLDSPYVSSQITPLEYKPKKIYELVKQGHYGVKTGKGFYDYKGKTEAEICEERDVKLIKMLKIYHELEEI